jgi:hypothetical protein
MDSPGWGSQTVGSMVTAAMVKSRAFSLPGRGYCGCANVGRPSCYIVWIELEFSHLSLREPRTIHIWRRYATVHCPIDECLCVNCGDHWNGSAPSRVASSGFHASSCIVVDSTCAPRGYDILCEPDDTGSRTWPSSVGIRDCHHPSGSEPGGYCASLPIACNRSPVRFACHIGGSGHRRRGDAVALWRSIGCSSSGSRQRWITFVGAGLKQRVATVSTFVHQDQSTNRLSTAEDGTASRFTCPRLWALCRIWGCANRVIRP